MADDHITELQRIDLNETFNDDWTRKIYSVDASHCIIKPLAVNFPSDEYDVQRVCNYAHTHNLPITCRGSGTGLLGQSLSNGIILDFTKKMNKILEVTDNYVVIQPGIIKTILDRELSKKGKFIPPDPASSNYCTIGGMISNNSSGPHGLGYGSMINYVEGVELIYSDGMIGYAGAKKHDDKVSEMVKFISSLDIDIKKYYPNVSKNSSGYRLDAIFEKNKINPQKIFVASEGSLGIVTKAKISIVNVPEIKHLVLLKFQNILDAVSAVPSILNYRPVAMELLDRSAMMDGWKYDDSHDSNSSVMFVEFHGNDNSLHRHVIDFEDNIRKKGKILEIAEDKGSIEKAWNERKNSLNTAMKKGIGSRKPVAIIEDTVVHPDLLYEYTIFLLKLLEEYNLDYVIYGHAGDGNLHLRPIIDTNSEDAILLMNKLVQDVFSYIIRVHGSISGEHGDGLLRTKYICMMYGSKLYNIFKQVKLIFDKKNIMNPGKKII